ncbi:MAG: ABC transporter ATP-binding protein [Rhodobacteraceae bacterium]|jgi:putative ABC transport system ATP-binding protein|nr:ABC transporter ATP-binding protein [Paracoccaceae bacterium]MBL4559145.1 ABC transporter ATP-binding protein [Paracoccaceae bacterium]
MTAPLIEFDRVCRDFGAGDALVRALDRVSLAIGRGEFVAIMGSSGSGKSTALNIMGGLDTETAGIYRFGGVGMRDLGRQGRTLVRRSFIGFVFQGFNLLPRASALENVELPLIYRREPPRHRRRRAAAALAQVGLAGREAHRPGALSGGQQQRVAIARAIVTGPDVLFADEPTGNLDTTTGAGIMALLAAMNRDLGVTLIVVTHEPEIAALADRCIRFQDGRIVADGPSRGMPPC